VSPTLLIIDLQQASCERPLPLFDVAGLVERLNALASRVRKASGRVIFVQYTGPAGTPYDPDQAGWQLVSGLDVEPADIELLKPASDAFQGSDLETVLGPPDQTELIVTGCDTEFCVDSTVRSALALGYAVTVPADGHSLTDRPHLTAEQIIEHHNAIWSTPGALAGRVTVLECSEILA